jgi:hypothetical protein
VIERFVASCLASFRCVGFFPANCHERKSVIPSSSWRRWRRFGAAYTDAPGLPPLMAGLAILKQAFAIFVSWLATLRIRVLCSMVIFSGFVFVMGPERCGTHSANYECKK